MALSLQPMAGSAGDARVSVPALASERFVASFLDQSPRSTIQLLPTSAFIVDLWTQGAGPLWPGLWLAVVVVLTAWRWRLTAAYVQRAACSGGGSAATRSPVAVSRRPGTSSADAWFRPVRRFWPRRADHAADRAGHGVHHHHLGLWPCVPRLCLAHAVVGGGRLVHAGLAEPEHGLRAARAGHRDVHQLSARRGQACPRSVHGNLRLRLW